MVLSTVVAVHIPLAPLPPPVTQTRHFGDDKVSHSRIKRPRRPSRPAQICPKRSFDSYAGTTMTPPETGFDAYIPANTWRELLSVGRPRLFAKREVILSQGTPGHHIAILVAGTVKVVRHSGAGEETLLAFRTRHHLLGEVAVIDGRERTASVIALGQVEARLIAADQFVAFIKHNHVELDLLRYVLGRLRESTEVRDENATLPVGQRLARLLLRLTSESSPAARGVTQLELAQAVAASRNAVVGELTALRRDGLVATGRRSIEIVDRAKLITHAGP